jgi:putative transposase
MSKSAPERRRLVNKQHKLSIARQCELLKIHRSGFYYTPKPETALNLKLMRMIDQEHMQRPWLGVPRIVDWLRQDKNIPINHKRIERLFKVMGISAIGPKPNTSKKAKGKGHKVYPYLLRGLKVTQSNQVWAMDITYIPVRGGYLYLCAIIDLYSRYVVGWSLSNTMTAQWCRETLEEAVEAHGAPEILNTDQGSQFTALEFSSWVVAPEQGIKLSMDGKGRAIDNIFIERLWRSVKYEHVYLFPSDNGIDCFKGIKTYFDYYNHQRRHSSIGRVPPFNYYEQFKKQTA